VLSAILIVLCVVATWWCTTGAILYLGRLPRTTYATSMILATALLVVASLLLRLSSHSTGATGACVAFGATLMVWGWLEMTFLLGAITGPRKSPATRESRYGERLRQAIGAILYHELATIGAGALVWLLTWHAPNTTALWTYLLLWAMRISAKLNLFLGVPNTGETMLPPHLKYLGSYFRSDRINPLFPVSVLLATLLFLALVIAAHRAPLWGGEATRLTLLATLAGLAVLEHWMLIVPMPADAPWSAWRPARALRGDSGSPS
jgi:putative photosynthetic complex assembly protein 2